LSAGYSILTYDRIGTGKSSKPDAYDIVQWPLHVEILQELTKIAKSGKLLSIASIPSRSPISEFKPEKIVQVGHSFGSIMVTSLLAKYGADCDGAILTGFVPIAQLGAVKIEAFGNEFAKESDPHRFGDRPSGYVVQGTKGAVQQIFFKKGAFDHEMLSYAERIKQTMTAGEAVSFAATIGGVAPEFKGPIQVSRPRDPSLSCAMMQYNTGADESDAVLPG
jgi:pimeloyl-ACP methyl ester carboxylesterase